MTELAFLGVAHIHTPGFANMIAKRDDVKVRLVWDPEKARAEHFARQWGAKIVDSPEALLSEDTVKSVVVCSQTNRHEALVIAAARARKHMFVEKPLGMGARDSYAMAMAIQDAGVLFQTGFFQRGDPKNRFIKELLEKGALGRITRVRGSNVHSGALGNWFAAKPDKPHDDWRWMADTTQSGVGGFGDLGAHALDILMWWMGDVKACTAQLDKVTNTYGCDESGEGLLRFANGAVGTMAAGWVDWADPVKYIVSGTEGHAAVINNELHLTSRKDERFDGSSVVRKNEMPKPVAHAFELFLDALAGRELPTPLVSAMEAARRSAVMEAMYKGAAESTWVAPAKH